MQSKVLTPSDSNFKDLSRGETAHALLLIHLERMLRPEDNPETPAKNRAATRPTRSRWLGLWLKALPLILALATVARWMQVQSTLPAFPGRSTVVAVRSFAAHP